MKIRPATPEDAALVAELMYMAGKAHVETSVYDLMMPGPPGPRKDRLQALENLFRTETQSWFHHSMYLVAEVEGKVAATLCGFNNVESGGVKLISALKEIGWGDEDIKEMGERLKPYLSVNPSLPDDAWVVENVATFSEYRGQGIMNSLLEAIIEQGREQGYRRFQVAVFIGNVAAQGAYEKAGFTVVEEYVGDSFEDVFAAPGMKRLVLDLES